VGAVAEAAGGASLPGGRTGRRLRRLRFLLLSAALTVVAVLGLQGCPKDAGTERVESVCRAKSIDIPQNGYVKLQLTGFCDFIVNNFREFRLDKAQNIELKGQLDDGHATVILHSTGTAGETASKEDFTLKYDDPNGCNSTNTSTKCRTHGTLQVTTTSTVSPPPLQLIEINSQQRAPHGNPEVRYLTAIEPNGLEVQWVKGAVDNTVYDSGTDSDAIHRLPTDGSRYLEFQGSEPIGVMVKDANGVIGYASGSDPKPATIQPQITCTPACPQQTGGRYQVSLNSGDSLDIVPSAQGGLFGYYDGQMETHRYVWHGLHSVPGQAGQQLSSVTQSGTILLEVFDSVDNRAQVELDVIVDGVPVPSLALSASSQTLAVADGGTINQGNDLVLDAQLNNPPGQYEVSWHKVTASQSLVQLGSGLPFTHQPSFDTHYRAQLMSGGQVLATADFNVMVDASPQYVPLRIQQVQDRGLVVSEPAGINCGIRDADSSDNCWHSYPIGNRVTLSVDAADIARFQGWQGCDQVEDNLATGDRCVVVMDGSRRAEVTFSQRSDYVLEFTSVDPDGLVTAYNMDADFQSIIDCRHQQGGVSGTCRAQLPNGTRIHLAGYKEQPFATFVQWGGDCAEFDTGSSSFVRFNINRDYYCTAEYTPDTHIQLNYTVAGDTTQVPEPLSIGSVQTNPVGQACYVGVDGCYGYPQGTGQVQVTGVPDTTDHPWLFYQWGGDCAAEVLTRHGQNLRFRDERTLTLDMQQDYATCEARFRTDVTRAVIDLSHPYIANVREIDHAANAPSTQDYNTCGDDCELIKLQDQSMGNVMDLVVDTINASWKFDGWDGCDAVHSVPAWSPEPVCRIGSSGPGVTQVRANFSQKGNTQTGGSN
jgi:hypothetical protein